MKLKIYTDLTLLTVWYPVELLIPFIGIFNEEDKPGRIMSSRFAEYSRKGREMFELTSIEEADVCLLPIYYKFSGDTIMFENAIKDFVNIVEKSRKKTIVFAGHDKAEVKVKIKNCIIFNSALHKSTQNSNVYSWPHFFEDYLEKYQNKKLIVRTKSEVPTVGFCGFAPPLSQKLNKGRIIAMIKLVANYVGIMKFFPAKASHSYRARAILGLRKTKILKTNFQLKSYFSFGPTGQLNTGDTKETDDAFRRNFVDNIIESDYTLCVRGIGNNSIRFFESLCCGRIPVFVNTDCVLPFDFLIDWKSLCVWIEESDIDKVDNIILDFHRNISAEDFINLQKKLRSIWEEYLSPIGFFNNLQLFIHN